MKQPNLKPLRNGVLAEQIFEEPEKVENKGSIILNIDAELENMKSEFNLAGLQLPKKEEKIPTNRLLILKTGKDCEEVKEGDTVIYNGRGTRLTHNKEPYLYLTEKDLIAIVEQ